MAARSEMVKGKLADETTLQELGVDYSKELERAAAKMQQAGVKLGSIQTSVQFAVERRANLEKVKERRLTVWTTLPESREALAPTVHTSDKSSEAVARFRRGFAMIRRMLGVVATILRGFSMRLTAPRTAVRSLPPASSSTRWSPRWRSWSRARRR